MLEDGREMLRAFQIHVLKLDRQGAEAMGLG